MTFVFDPPVFVAFSETVKDPGVVYVCNGFRCVEFTEDPSPNDQFQLVGVPVEVSANCTTSGAVPVVGEPVKPATGATSREK